MRRLASTMMPYSATERETPTGEVSHTLRFNGIIVMDHSVNITGEWSLSIFAGVKLWVPYPHPPSKDWQIWVPPPCWDCQILGTLPTSFL